MEDPHRLTAQKSGQLEICELPIWIITPISKRNHRFPGVISSASVAGVHIQTPWLSVASWCEMMVMQLVVKHTGLCANINVCITQREVAGVCSSWRMVRRRN